MKTPEEIARDIVDRAPAKWGRTVSERTAQVWLVREIAFALRESSKVVPEGGEVARLRKQVTTLARVEGELRKTIAFARQALLTARDAMKREAWQEGPTIGNAERALGEMIDVIKHEITVEHAEYQLKWAAKKACDAIRERNALRASCEELTSFIAVMVGRGPDAEIPETIDTPIGVPVKIGEIMRTARAAITSSSPDSTRESALSSRGEAQ